MFDFLKKKKPMELIIGSPVKGKAVPLSSVNDPTFSEGMLHRQTEQSGWCLIHFMRLA